MSENKEEKTGGIQPDLNKTQQIIVQKVSDMSPVRTVRILLLIFCVLFIIGIWFHNNPATKPVSPEDNEEETVDGSPSTEPEPTPLPAELTDPSSITVFIDKTHSLPADYVPAELVMPYVYSTSDVIQVNALAADALKSMVNTANEQGITLYLTSGYISYETQNEYFSDRAAMVGETEANKVIAKAGFSEHQTGLAFDFSDDASGTATTTAFADTDAGKWLMTHAHEYGFILRYPKDKEAITGYSYQPWHYRYVGTDVANAMYSQAWDLTMEEYYNIK